MVLAPGPSPTPFSPWQRTQLSEKSCSPAAKFSGVEGIGFFTFFASSGATQGGGVVCSCAAIRPTVKIQAPNKRPAPAARKTHFEVIAFHPVIPVSPIASAFVQAEKFCHNAARISRKSRTGLQPVGFAKSGQKSRSLAPLAKTRTGRDDTACCAASQDIPLSPKRKP